IVHSIAQAMGGEVRCEASPLGAPLLLSCRSIDQLPDFTSDCPQYRPGDGRRGALRGQPSRRAASA
ncbi:hypothetical protein C6P47_29695, partial [Klebsiella pneumoniae]